MVMQAAPAIAPWAPSAMTKLAASSLAGMLLARPNLRLMPEAGVVVDAARDPAHVAVIGGGGSGHEPGDVGLMGRGMLAAAACGGVFASPTTDAVLSAIYAVAPSPALLVIKNTRHDRLSFGLAAEQARAAGLRVGAVIVGDCCGAEVPGLEGRRGLAGVALVAKVAGAAAAQGRPLDEVAALAQAAASSVATLGIAVGRGVHGVGLGPQGPQHRGAEFGVGLGGEPGSETQRAAPLPELVPHALRRLLGYRGGGADPLALFAGRPPLVLLVNNLGGSSNLELFAAASRAADWLQGHGHNLQRVLVGTVLTSLNTEGASLSLMPCDAARLALLDAATDAPGWPAFGGAVGAAAPARERLPLPAEVAALRAQRAELLRGQPLGAASPAGRRADAAVRAAAAALLGASARLDELDWAADGDSGRNCGAAARALLDAPEGAFAGAPAETLVAAAAAIQEAAAAKGLKLAHIYHFGLSAAAAALQANGGGAADAPEQWAAALAAGVRAVKAHGGASKGGRTALDALIPAADAAVAAAAAGSDGPEVARAAARAARAGADATRGMPGQSHHARGAAIAEADPGAEAAAVWLEAVAAALAEASA